ncbi:hypothetical protein H5410_002318 [Solanum commersonii]|uniref:Uncharacterized protein n=1 Tax=Solanum commersonii TaxID=4109 RepID=A0A9J6B1M1_SOLCO|nr:hypothetical protein H5410_002318 [Solanum commersonii]
MRDKRYREGSVNYQPSLTIKFYGINQVLTWFLSALMYASRVIAVQKRVVARVEHHQGGTQMKDRATGNNGVCEEFTNG